jgi:2-phosphosulfolactate phosphatase
MHGPREVRVYLTPAMIPHGAMAGGIAVAIDVLRATTTMLTALAAGAKAIIPCGSIDDTKAMAGEGVLLAGERGGRAIPGFDLGNSPAEFTATVCKNKTIVTTTTNGTAAILACRPAELVTIGAFVNFSAVCEQLDADARPVHIVCAGTNGEPTLDDTLFAGAVVDHLSATSDVQLNDSARLAWDSFENHGQILMAALEISAGGEALIKVGLGDDLKLAAAVDKLALTAAVTYDPPRIQVASAGIKRKHWQHS